MYSYSCNHRRIRQSGCFLAKICLNSGLCDMSASKRPLLDQLAINYDFLVDELISSYFVNKLYEKEVLCEEDKQQMTNPELGRSG